MIVKSSGTGVFFAEKVDVNRVFFHFKASPPKTSVFVRKCIQFVAAENGSVLADIFRTDIAPAAFTDAAFHAKFHCCVYLSFIKSDLAQSGKGKFNHYRRTAENRDFVG